MHSPEETTCIRPATLYAAVQVHVARHDHTYCTHNVCTSSVLKLHCNCFCGIRNTSLLVLYVYIVHYLLASSYMQGLGVCRRKYHYSFTFSWTLRARLTVKLRILPPLPSCFSAMVPSLPDSRSRRSSSQTVRVTRSTPSRARVPVRCTCTCDVWAPGAPARAERVREAFRGHMTLT